MFSGSAWRYRQSLVQYGACAPSNTKMGTEVVGPLTHADASQRGNAQHPASRMRLSRFTIDTHMQLLFAGATHAGQNRVREQIRVTLKSPRLDWCSSASLFLCCEYSVANTQYYKCKFIVSVIQNGTEYCCVVCLRLDINNNKFYCLVWCPGLNKITAPFPFISYIHILHTTHALSPKS
jgi:hypothetical protein